MEFDGGELVPARRQTIARAAPGEWVAQPDRSPEEPVVGIAFLRRVLLGLPAVPAHDGNGLRGYPKSFRWIVEPLQQELVEWGTNEGETVPVDRIR